MQIVQLDSQMAHKMRSLVWKILKKENNKLNCLLNWCRMMRALFIFDSIDTFKKEIFINILCLHTFHLFFTLNLHLLSDTYDDSFFLSLNQIVLSKLIFLYYNVDVSRPCVFNDSNAMIHILSNMLQFHIL